MTPYRTRKVRILNGAHTMSILAAFLCGHETVLGMMGDEVFRALIQKGLFDEVMPTLTLPRDELESFAEAVLERFSNPFIQHRLLDISLNSTSKFKSRCLPSLTGYIEKFGEAPRVLTFALAALALFYKGKPDNGAYTGSREDGSAYPVNDDREALDFFAAVWAGYEKSKDVSALAREILANESMWGGDLNAYSPLPGALARALDTVLKNGVREAASAL